MPQWMQAFMAQQEQYTALQQQRMHSMQEHYQAQIQGLQAAVQALQQSAETPTSTPEPPPVDTLIPASRRTKAILPNPPKFDGTRNDFEGWKSLIKDKIKVNSEIISSD